MRKGMICVLMISFLLSACAAAEGENGDDLALKLRGEYLAAESCSGTACVTADYGQRVYQYELEFQSNEEETLLTLTAPETVAGLTARLSWEEGSVLEYDGAVIETGPLNQDGLTPVSSIPSMLRTVREGYLDACMLEESEEGTTLRLTSRDPEQDPGNGAETVLWFDPGTFQLLRGEIWQDGFCVIQCEFSTFSNQMKDSW